MNTATMLLVSLMALLGRTQQQALQSTDHRPVILAFGDSLTSGYGVPAGSSYPEQLQRKLDSIGYQYRVVNMGLAGDTTNGARGRMNRALALNPTIVVLELGGNDASSGLRPSQTEANLEQMIMRFQSGGTTVVLAGGRLSSDDVFDKLSRKYHVPLISSFLEGVEGNPRLTISDGVHPNAQGCAVVANTVMRAIEPLLKK